MSRTLNSGFMFLIGLFCLKNTMWRAINETNKNNTDYLLVIYTVMDIYPILVPSANKILLNFHGILIY